MGLTKTFGCYTVWTGACLSVVELLLSFCAALGFGLEKFWVGLAIAVVAVVFLFVELYGLSAQKFGIIVAIGIFRFLAALTSLVGKKSFGSPQKKICFCAHTSLKLHVFRILKPCACHVQNVMCRVPENAIRVLGTQNHLRNGCRACYTRHIELIFCVNVKKVGK